MLNTNVDGTLTRGQTILLASLSVSLVVQLHIESSAGTGILWKTLQGVLSCVVL